MTDMQKMRDFEAYYDKMFPNAHKLEGYDLTKKVLQHCWNAATTEAAAVHDAALDAALEAIEEVACSNDDGEIYVLNMACFAIRALKKQPAAPVAVKDGE